MGRPPRDYQERFWEKVSTEATPLGCLLWLGAVDEGGYGALRVGERIRRAHHVAWELEHGPVPKGMVLMHACDERACVNVDHLRAGTHSQNTQDMLRKGRAGSSAPKLTAAERADVVTELRDGASISRVAAKFKISKTVVYRVLERLRRQGLVRR